MTAASRAIAIAVPIRDEAETLGACIAALDAAAARHDGMVAAFVLLNNCTDAGVDILRAARPRHLRLLWREERLPPARANPGWARRIALDGAAALLARDRDLLLTTDGDTSVDPDWIAATVRHVDRGAGVVAGRALTRRVDRTAFDAAARTRLNLLTRYHTAIDWLRARAAPPHDPWPRHYYEGGASIATTRAAYRATGGAPTPSVGEDRALVAALARTGARVRHPLDVRVFTSSRIVGRATGGMADTWARWIAQGEHAPIAGTFRLDAALAIGEPRDADRLSFAQLPAALAEAQRRIRSALPTPPDVEAIFGAAIRAQPFEPVADPV